MQVFCVFRKGVWRHECAGVFTDDEKACEAAVELLRAQPDDHHCFEVVPFVLNETGVTLTGNAGRWGEIDEPDALVTYYRPDGLPYLSRDKPLPEGVVVLDDAER